MMNKATKYVAIYDGEIVQEFKTIQRLQYTSPRYIELDSGLI